MTWSFSQGRTFKTCPRRWFYKALFSESRSKDPLRREAYVLSKLQSIHSWRGQIVDSVIGESVVAELNAKRVPVLKTVIKSARERFDRQRAFGLEHRVREPKMSVSEAGPEFTAFFNVEYELALKDEDFANAWSDIEKALRNLWNLQAIRDQIRNAQYLVAQRNLIFEHCGSKVRAVPDLIVFFSDKPPLIVDWKVHTFGTRDYADQLATYALALARVAPHKDFPLGGRHFAPSDIGLVEVQLLLGTARTHVLSKDDFEEAEERIAEGITALELALDGRKPCDLCATDFPTARNPESCMNCPFRKICWN